MIRTAALIVIFLSLSINALGVVITEIHRDPAVGNKNAIPGGLSHEFVELTNFSSDTFYMRDIFLSNGKVADSIRLFDSPISLHTDCHFTKEYIPPGASAVILPQNYLTALEDFPSTVLPVESGTIMFTVNHKNMGGNLANDDGIAIYKGTRNNIDSLIDIAADPETHLSSPTSGKIVLNPRQPKGFSVIPTSLLLGERNYIVSSSAPMSPGKYEPLTHGLFIEHSVSMVSQAAVRCSLAGIFVNSDSETAVWSLFSFSRDNGRTEIKGGDFSSQKRQFLLTFDITLEQKQYFFEVIFNNKTITHQLDLSAFWAAGGMLRITELFPKGGASAGQPEWFELKNVSPANINLKNWFFGNSKDSAVITQRDFLLSPGNFVAVTKDTAFLRGKYRSMGNAVQPNRWHTLNSFNDTLSIWSPQGVEIDVAVYKSAWFSGWKNSQSLERVFTDPNVPDSLSWVLCDYPTPGLPGEVSLWRAVKAPSIDIGPVPFFPGRTGGDNLLSIRMKVEPGFKAVVKIISFDGRILKSIKGEQEVILWDGICDGGRSAPPGVIYVVAEFTSGSQRKVIRKKGVLWR
ncbi:MAG: lamin tail domain-containing protein [Chitinispirillales bacterium]|nr:lamin tail domain-containing protein [Chitinispirillales bacterium]